MPTFTPASPPKSADDEGDLTDLLGELRTLLPGAQLLSAFLVTVPFMEAFKKIVASEKYVFLVTFLLAVVSLVLLSAPAVQHRLVRPLQNRVGYKQLATRQIICGAVALALALVLVTQFVLSEVMGHLIGSLAAALVGVVVGFFWWVLPKVLSARRRI